METVCRSNGTLWLDTIAGHGDATAIVHYEGITTYGELLAGIKQLESVLRDNNISSGTIVEVSAIRHPDLVTALLACWAVGAAVVIDDRNDPEKRRRSRRSFFNPAASIQVGLNIDACGSDRELVICRSFEGWFSRRLETPSSFIGSATNVDHRIAYIQFTSGTTGSPKAVAGSHDPIVSFISWYKREFGFAVGTRFALLAGLGHDPVYRDILTPLLCGGILHIPTDDIRGDPTLLFRWLKKSDVNVIHTTPLVVDALSIAAEGDKLSALTHVLVGGDILNFAVVERFHEVVSPACRIFNVYGTTETPQIIGMYEAPRGTEIGASSSEIVPVGLGINGSVLEVVRDPATPESADARGEIIVSSRQLALGYLDPKGNLMPLSNIHGPVSHYRTGDIGVALKEGNILCLGRGDDCINMGGERVHVAEVADAIRHFPLIRNCVIDVIRPTRNSLQLVAHCVLIQDELPSNATQLTAEIRTFLLDWLPAIAVPGTFQFLRDIPKTSNGKADVRTLREFSNKANEPAKPEISWDNEFSPFIADIWKKYFKEEELVQSSDFFALGGHSLQAIRIVQAINKKFELTLPMDLLWSRPTIASIAELVRAEKEMATTLSCNQGN